jgi:hypothetical protein
VFLYNKGMFGCTRIATIYRIALLFGTSASKRLLELFGIATVFRIALLFAILIKTWNSIC